MMLVLVPHVKRLSTEYLPVGHAVLICTTAKASRVLGLQNTSASNTD